MGVRQMTARDETQRPQTAGHEAHGAPSNDDGGLGRSGRYGELHDEALVSSA